MRPLALRHDHPAVDRVPVAAGDRELAGAMIPLARSARREVGERAQACPPSTSATSPCVRRVGERLTTSVVARRGGAGRRPVSDRSSAATSPRGADLGQHERSPAAVLTRARSRPRYGTMSDSVEVDRLRVGEPARRAAGRVDDVQRRVAGDEVAAGSPHVLRREVEHAVEPVADFDDRAVAVRRGEVAAAPPDRSTASAKTLDRRSSSRPGVARRDERERRGRPARTRWCGRPSRPRSAAAARRPAAARARLPPASAHGWRRPARPTRLAPRPRRRARGGR